MIFPWTLQEAKFCLLLLHAMPLYRPVRALQGVVAWGVRLVGVTGLSWRGRSVRAGGAACVQKWTHLYRAQYARVGATVIG